MIKYRVRAYLLKTFFVCFVPFQQGEEDQDKADQEQVVTSEPTASNSNEPVIVQPAPAKKEATEPEIPPNETTALNSGEKKAYTPGNDTTTTKDDEE